MNKRVLLAYLLMSILWISSAYAQFAGGTGTEDDPWLISTRSQLEQLNNYLGADHSDKYYRQTADIDLSAAPWNPIGRATPFYGQYDGDGFSIIGLNITDFQGGPSGLFARITDSKLCNIRMTTINISFSMDFYGVAWTLQDVAPLAVYVSNTILENCSTAGNVSLTVTNGGTHMISGLAGHLDDSSTMLMCKTNCNVDVASIGTLWNYSWVTDSVGGLVAINHGLVSECYSVCNVSAFVSSVGGSDPGELPDPVSESSEVGGIVGSNQGLIQQCRFVGGVSGTMSIGGIVGGNSGSISQCFASATVYGSTAIGGIAGGTYSGTINNCYSDVVITYVFSPFFSEEYAGAGGGVGTVYSGGSVSNIHSRYTSVNTLDPNLPFGFAVIGQAYTSSVQNCYWDDWTDDIEPEYHWLAYPNYLLEPYYYQNWDFTSIWKHDVNGAVNFGLPYLRYQENAPKVFSSAKSMSDIATLAYQFKAIIISFNDLELSYHWDFGDGSTSTEEDPLHIYSNSGLYQVTLTVINAFDSTGTHTRTLNVEGNPANFTASSTIGNTPLTVEFSDVTPMIISQWEWDFDGDGNIDSIEENPVWTYLYPGVYTVTMTVSNGTDSYTATRTNYITASLNPSITHYVPAQFTTIQSAINASADGDYIIVADGTYYENLVIEGKSITLASYFFVDGDSSHIANTIIDGSNAINPDQASTITILPSSGRTVSQPHVSGFTIRSGSGRRIIQNEGGTTIEKRVGGGIYTRSANPIFSFNRIEDNDADDEGGGSYAFQSLPNFGGMVNATVGIRNPGVNRFRNNHADIGSDIYIQGITSRDEVKIQDCSFEVFSSADTTLSNYWATSSAPLSFSGCGGLSEAISSDVWVATNGSDTLNDGLSPQSPFRTIDHALSRIYATPENPLVIHIASGTYSPSLTGEKFPLQMVKHVSLQGAGEDETFLDAEGSADFPRRVLNLDQVIGVQVSGLTLMNGFVTLAKNYNGGAIGILNSQASLSNLIVAGSSAAGNGAGIYALDSFVEADSLVIQYNSALGSGGGIHAVQADLSLSSSQINHNSVSKNGAGLSLDGGVISLSDCEIAHNQATGYQSKGGGISLSGTENAILYDNRIAFNSADNGAGIYLQDNSTLKLDRNRINNNLADYNGGALFVNTTTGLLTNNLIANNTATQRGGGLYCYSSPLLVNNTVAHNNAGLQGGAFYLNTASPSLLNCLVWGNVQGNPEAPNQIYLYGDNADPEIRFSLLQGGSSGFGISTNAEYDGIYLNNQDQDPLFVDASEGAGHYFEIGEASFSLSEASPAIDAGDPETDCQLFPLDLGGNPRLDNERIDIGAWETVHFEGARIVAEPAAVDFGRVNISGEPVVQQISLSNTRNQPLLISELSLETPIADFSWNPSVLSMPILPGSSVNLQISFDPQQLGVVHNALIITNNSLNNPVLMIPLRGYGIDASSSQPSNVTLEINGYDVNISWEPVLSDPLGNPFTPEGYIVLYSETINATLDDYLYLTFSTGTSAVHTAVARFQDRMFYRVIAVDGSTRAAIQSLLAGEQRTKQLRWREIKGRLNITLPNNRAIIPTSHEERK